MARTENADELSRKPCVFTYCIGVCRGCETRPPPSLISVDELPVSSEAHLPALWYLVRGLLPRIIPGTE
jgi:hypothetical protein